MPSRRDLIRMTPEEEHAYLASQRRVILVTVGPEGMPHPVPMNYALDDDGRVILTSFAKSQKIRNLERDPRATLLVESGDTYEQLKSVMLYADVEILRDPEAVIDCMRRIGEAEAARGGTTEANREQVQASAAKRVVLRFTPFRTVSWDHTKLGGLY